MINRKKFNWVIALGLINAIFVFYCIMAPMPAEAGKLKTALLSTSAELKELKKEISDYAEDVKNNYSDLESTSGRAQAGVEGLFLYLNEKLKSKNMKLKENLDKKISEFSDSNVEMFLKGIADAKSDTLKLVDLDLGAELRAQIDDVKPKLDRLDKLINKKKKKWFKSKKYKAKIKKYVEAIDKVKEKAARLEKAFGGAEKHYLTKAKVDRFFTFSLDNTLGDLDGLTMSVQALMANVEKEVALGIRKTRKARQGGDLVQELKMMRQWVKEADKMD